MLPSFFDRSSAPDDPARSGRPVPPSTRSVGRLGALAPLAALAVLGPLVVLGPLAAPAAAQNVSYSVVPSYQEIRWDDAFGLERTRLPGVRASLDFGPFFSLQPFYLWKDGVGLRDGVTPGSATAELFDVKAMGADLQVNLGRGSLFPFIRGGGGVLRTEDEAAGERDRVFLRYGAGLGFGLGSSASAEFFAENWSTRLDAPFVPGAVPEADFPDDGIVNSLVLGAGVRIPFGGGYRDAQGVSGLLPGIFLEPYAARIDFADELRLGRQYAAGVRAGVDFNQNVGLRAFAWRGVDDDFSEWMELEGYGAEAQFALNTGPGLSPFLIVGAGRIDFKDDFRDLDDQPRSRQDHLTLGGGIGIGLGDRTRIEFGARNLLMTVGSELEDVTDPDQLVSNWQYSAGLSFTLGAQPRSARVRAAEREQGQARAELERERAELERERARAQAELEAMRRENDRLRAGEDPARVERTVVSVDTVSIPGVTGMTGTGRTMTIPVPEVGEIILRFGDAYAVGATATGAGLTQDQLAELERRIMEALLARGALAPGDTARARMDRELLEARLPEMIRRIVREEMERMHGDPMGMDRPGMAARPVTGEDGTFLRGRRLEAIRPFTGFQVDSPTQLLLGARADLGLLSEVVPLRLLPEVAFGLGEDNPSLRVAMNTAFEWNFGGTYNVTPYGLAGVAISNRRFLTADLGYGVKFDVRGDSASPLRVFVEHRGVSWFRDNQFLVGLSLRR